MNKFLLAITALLCLAARAVAADTPAKGGQPQAPAGFQWAGGVYVGINGGYAFGRRHDVTDFETVNVSSAPSAHSVRLNQAAVSAAASSG